MFVAYESQSGDAMVVYGDNTSNAYYRIWDGASWTAQQTITPPGGVSGQLDWTSVASDPNSDRIAFAAHTDGDDTWLAVWDGTSWGDQLLASTNEKENTFQSVAVAFESQSGELLAVYTEDNNKFSYRTWNDTSGWSSETLGADLGNNVRTITLTSRPETDQIMLTALDDGKDLNNLVWDGATWGAKNEVENDTGEQFVQPFVFLWDQNPSEFVAAANDTAFWFSTDGDVNADGAAGLNAWTAGEAIALSDPDLSLEPASGTTSGTISSIFNLDDFGGDTKIDALHYVTADIQVGSSNFDLFEGDVLFSTRDDETLVSTNTLAISKNDVIVFRADTTGDYSSGTFYVLLDNPIATDVRSISLVEQNTTVGDTTLQAGDFLLSTDAVGFDTSILLYETTDVGAGTTSGTLQTLLAGLDANVALTKKINGIELYETDSTIGGHTILAGTLAISLDADSSVGSNSLAVKKQDIFALNISQTTLVSGSGNGAATALLLMDGSDIGLIAGAEKIAAIAAFPNNQTPTDIAPDSVSVNEFVDTTAGYTVATLTTTDADAGETFTYSIMGGADAAKFSIGGASSDELRLTDGALDYETQSSYSVTVRVTDSASNFYDESLTVNVNDLNDAPTVATNTGTTVLEGATGTAITTAMLNEGDVDDSGTGLTYTITNVTDNGTMYLAGFGALGLNDTFTQADIDAGDVTYDHNGSETNSDAFSFSLADGLEDGATAATGTFNITITPVNDEQSLDTNGGLTLNEGATGTITASELATSDADHAAAQIVYSVDTASTNGTLMLNWVALSASDTFTQADIDAGLVTYRHDGGETTSDTFDFTVDDGTGTSTSGTFNFTITPVNDAPVNMLSGQPQTIAGAGIDGATDVHAADLDGDGDVDLVATSWTDDRVTWLQNDGTGSFTEYTIDTGITGARHAFVADIDGDTHLDVLVSDYENDTVTWYENDGRLDPNVHRACCD